MIDLSGNKLNSLKDALRFSLDGFQCSWDLAKYWQGFEGDQSRTQPADFRTVGKIAIAEIRQRELVELTPIDACLVWATAADGWPADANDLVHLAWEIDQLNHAANRAGVGDMVRLRIDATVHTLSIGIDERNCPPLHDTWRLADRDSIGRLKIEMQDSSQTILDGPTDRNSGNGEITVYVGTPLADFSSRWLTVLDRLTGTPSEISPDSPAPMLPKYARQVLLAFEPSIIIPTLTDIGAKIQRDRKTISPTVDSLKHHGLIATPDGERSGYAITVKGCKWLQENSH